MRKLSNRNELDELPEGQRVLVQWSGNNEQAEYIVRVSIHDLRYLQDPYSFALENSQNRQGHVMWHRPWFIGDAPQDQVWVIDTD